MAGIINPLDGATEDNLLKGWQVLELAKANCRCWKHISPSLYEVCEKQEPLSSEEALRFAESEMSHAVDSVNAFISALSGDSPHDDLVERVASQKQAILDNLHFAAFAILGSPGPPCCGEIQLSMDKPAFMECTQTFSTLLRDLLETQNKMQNSKLLATGRTSALKAIRMALRTASFAFLPFSPPVAALCSAIDNVAFPAANCVGGIWVQIFSDDYHALAHHAADLVERIEPLQRDIMEVQSALQSMHVSIQWTYTNPELVRRVQVVFTIIEAIGIVERLPPENINAPSTAVPSADDQATKKTATLRQLLAAFKHISSAFAETGSHALTQTIVADAPGSDIDAMETLLKELRAPALAVASTPTIRITPPI